MSNTYVEGATATELKDSVVEVQPFHFKKHTSLNSYKGKDLVLKNNSESCVMLDPNQPLEVGDMMKKFGLVRRDQTMFPNNDSLPTYGDFTIYKDFAERAELYTQCQNQFYGLPSEIRDNFNNDMGKFAVFVNQKDFNIERLMTKDFKEKVYYPHLNNKKYEEYKKQFFEETKSENLEK